MHVLNHVLIAEINPLLGANSIFTHAVCLLGGVYVAASLSPRMHVLNHVLVAEVRRLILNTRTTTPFTTPSVHTQRPVDFVGHVAAGMSLARVCALTT